VWSPSGSELCPGRCASRISIRESSGMRSRRKSENDEVLRRSFSFDTVLYLAEPGDIHHS
jgi:hypothetical protein